MIKFTSNIRALKKDWINLKNKYDGEPYLTYSFIYDCDRYLRFKWFLNKRKTNKIFYFFNVKNGNIVAIAPIVIDYAKREISFLGIHCDAGYNDLIYAKNTELKDLEELLIYLKQKYSSYEFNLDQLSNKSKLCSSSIIKTEDSKQCYALTINNGFEDWIRSLGRGERQTARGIYNRLKTDNAHFAFKFEKNSSFTTKFLCFKIYKKRLNEIIAEKTRIKRFKQKVYEFLSNMNLFFISPFFNRLNKHRNAILATIHINGKIASFQICFRDQSEYIIPKMGFDSKFSRYNPGFLLNIELFKLATRTSNVHIFDFSRGYHEYKIKYNCKEYYLKKSCFNC